MSETIIYYKKKKSKVVLKDGIIIKEIYYPNNTESIIQQKASESGIAPKVYNTIYDPKGYIVRIEMEYIEGCELDQYIKNISEEDRLLIKNKVLNTINALYAIGIDHGDLTGKNIIVTKDLEIKIIDYGSSKFQSEIKRDYTILKNW